MCDRNEQVLPLGFNDFPYRVFMHVFFVGVCACMSVHVYACMHVRKYVCMYVCMQLVSKYVCMYAGMPVCCMLP